MIDTHAHLVTGDTAAYPPSPPSGALNPGDLDDPMTVERLLGEMDASGVEKAVLVQRGSIYGFDSSYVCDSAARHPARLAAVCSIDAAAADCGAAVEHWIRDRGAAGIRLMELVRGMGIGWLDSPLARDAWKAAAELEAPVCVHLFPWNRAEGLTCLAGILRDIPNVTVVIDHFGAIASDAGPPDHGVDELLEQVAAFDGTTIKFTTIPLGRLDKAGIDYRPVVERVAALFGPDRMMWGSDITQSPGSYAYMADLGRSSVEGFGAREREQILSGTAERVYGRGWH
ncbi:amidohydrolase family protein [Sphingomonas canadensis]|uniref:Amidohydrolase family protein n=1 Tax=Sphingomonas canadensis TaxID=1219257 RepID=A0ABW3HCR4_9SPHN|nr:amidohydrolase family protein [Sphingomonas canadensis]MCW3838317.1 amidohydrolase [Sphingomonas canadensis]